MKKIRTILVAFAAILFCIATITSCKKKCDCNACKENCSCDKKGCSCAEEFIQKQQEQEERKRQEEENRKNQLINEFANSKWSGLDENGREVTLVVEKPNMTLTYYVKTYLKRNFTLEKKEITTNSYSYNPNTGKFKDEKNDAISGEVTSSTSLDVNYPGGKATLTKQ